MAQYCDVSTQEAEEGRAEVQNQLWPCEIFPTFSSMADEVHERVKALSSQPDNLSSVPQIHRMELNL